MRILALAAGLVLTAAAISPAPTAVAAGEEPAASSKNTVIIEDFKFKPAELTVTKGSEVTFINKDSAPHNATPKKQANFEATRDLQKGESDTVKFDNIGKHPYYCTIHPNMEGTVTVVQ